MKITHSKNNPILFSFLLLFSFSCSNKSPENEAIEAERNNQEIVLTEMQFKSANMQLGQSKEIAFQESIIARGILEARPENKQRLSSYFEGYVKETSLLAGQKVSRGQTLFTLENPEYLVIQQEFLETKSMLNFYKDDFERQKGLAAEKVSSEKKFQQAKSDYEVTAARYASLKRKLELMNIKTETLSPEKLKSTIKITAPIDGYISTVQISRGQFLSPNETALEIVDTKNLKLAITIYEKDLPKVKLGQDLSFSLANYPNKEFQASIDLISPVIDLDKRSVLVHASLKQDDYTEKLNPGTYIEVEIISDSKYLFSLGREAMVQKGAHYEALVLDKKKGDQYFFKIIQLDVKASTEESFGFELPPAYRDKQFLLNGTFSLLGE